ncbi:MAG: heavy-metal-associated domain-containing protein, partial [Clostridiales bacterium]|nr:heavy-metal-associated domain-containing protein [Clostridiales bacterium]
MRKVISIEGMTCGHCAMHVEEALKELDGVKSAEVNLEAKTATVEIDHEIADQKLKA